VTMDGIVDEDGREYRVSELDEIEIGEKDEP
jgi:hypothetical protein